MKEFHGRKVAFKALVGSHNYNLNDEESDRDYKYFVLPTFDDLYNGSYFSIPSQVSKEMDFDVHDIRKLPQLWWKSNINFVEVLFSKEIVFPTPLDLSIGEQMVHFDLLNAIFESKDEIARMNLPYLYHACKGVHYNKMSLLYRGTSGTKHLVDKFGYDTKQALHAYRVLDFCERLVKFDFDFAQAMTYSGTERDFMLSIKHGIFKINEYEDLIAYKLKKFLTLDEVYAKIPTDETTHGELKRLIKELVQNSL